jgi:hypothetical protein
VLVSEANSRCYTGEVYLKLRDCTAGDVHWVNRDCSGDFARLPNDRLQWRFRLEGKNISIVADGKVRLRRARIAWIARVCSTWVARIGCTRVTGVSCTRIAWVARVSRTGITRVAGICSARVAWITWILRFFARTRITGILMVVSE